MISAVPGDSALAVVTGQWHTCTVLTDGSVYCWGENDNGQLGTGDTSSTLIPAKVSGLRAGAWMTCGLAAIQQMIDCLVFPSSDSCDLLRRRSLCILNLFSLDF